MNLKAVSLKFRRPKLWLPTSKDIAESASIRTVPELVDYNASHNPDYLFCHQAQKTGDAFRLFDVTHRQLRDAVVQCQEWLLVSVQELERPFTNENALIVKGRPVALFMESDVGLWIHLLALMGLGVPALLLSARLSSTAVHHLLKSTGACAVLVSRRLRRTCEEGISVSDPDLLPPAMYERKPYDFFLRPIDTHVSQSTRVCKPGYYVDVTDTRVIILHSSGTTGLPKPIFQSHEYLLGFAAAHEFSNEKESQHSNLSTLPLYHGFGLIAPSLSMSVGLTLCLPVTSISPGSTVVELLEVTGASSLMTVPSVLEDISLLPEDVGIKALRDLDFVAFGGGLLKPSVGNRLGDGGVTLLNHYGATEVGALSPVFVPKPELSYDFHYFRLRKDLGLQIIQVEASGENKPRYKLVTHPFGWNEKFEILDQLVRNPKAPERDFNAVGRKDDMIVLATGEKVLPNILETILSESEWCKVAIAFGQNQFEIGVLVEPRESISPEHYDKFKDDIWPTIERANKRMDAHARISSKNTILIVGPDRTIPRSDKGSVMRKEVYAKFEKDILQVYSDLEKTTSGTSLDPLDPTQLEASIKGLIQEHLDWKIPCDGWTQEDDLFELGMDSLQAMQLRRLLMACAPSTNSEQSLDKLFPRDFVYQNPSVSKLASSLRGAESIEDDDAIERFAKLYSTDADQNGAVVLLTGSTGSLGSHLLAHLATMPTVARIICLNREPLNGKRSDPRERLVRAVESKDISLPNSAWSKIDVTQTDLAAPFLGLSKAKYDSICTQVTHILHNAWPMDFNRHLPSFTTQFRTLQTLVQLTVLASTFRPTTHRPKLLFVSSIAVVGQYPNVHHERIIPEISMIDGSCTNDFGYARAKLVCEKIVENAARIHGDRIETAYVRVGQMAGAESSGFWSTAEHFPALVKSSQLVGALPSLQGTLSWLPVDHAATAMSEMLFSPSQSTATPQILHLENPIRQSWHDVLATLASELRTSKQLTIALVPYDEWLERVLAFTSDDDDANANPAKKLAEFFENDFRHMSGGQVVLDTGRARSVSGCLRGQGEVDEEVVRGYVEYWRRVGWVE